MGKNTRSRNWCLTINYKDIKPMEDSELEVKLSSIKGVNYYVFQLEKGKKETLHHQIYVNYANAKEFKTIKNIFPTAHIEQMKGTPQQASEYCQKEDTRERDPIIYGELPEQGRRTDLLNIYELLATDIPLKEIREEYPSQYIMYQNKFKSIKQELLEEKFNNTLRMLEVIYMCDIPGIGKTRYIFEKHGLKNVYRVSNYDHPFDSYNNEDVIVFDEFYSNLKINEMLNYLDIYPIKLPSRYYDKQACYTKVYIVSNQLLEDQYNRVQREKPQTWRALLRRIHFNGKLSEVKRYEEQNGLF